MSAPESSLHAAAPGDFTLVDPPVLSRNTVRRD